MRDFSSSISRQNVLERDYFIEKSEKNYVVKENGVFLLTKTQNEQIFKIYLALKYIFALNGLM